MKVETLHVHYSAKSSWIESSSVTSKEITLTDYYFWDPLEFTEIHRQWSTLTIPSLYIVPRGKGSKSFLPNSILNFGRQHLWDDEDMLVFISFIFLYILWLCLYCISWFLDCCDSELVLVTCFYCLKLSLWDEWCTFYFRYCVLTDCTSHLWEKRLQQRGRAWEEGQYKTCSRKKRRVNEVAKG